MESPELTYKDKMEYNILVAMHPQRYKGQKHLKLDAKSDEVMISLWSNQSENVNQPYGYICLSHEEAKAFLKAALHRLEHGVDVPDPRQLIVAVALD